MGNKICNDYYENITELSLTAGLAFVGQNGDDEPEWIGTVNEWNKQNCLINKI